MDLGEWLAAFRENGIDPSVLPDLTDQDLEKLGVLLGHRRKLLRAITNVEGLEKSLPAVAASAVGSAPVAVQPRLRPNIGPVDSRLGELRVRIRATLIVAGKLRGNDDDYQGSGHPSGAFFACGEQMGGLPFM